MNQEIGGEAEHSGPRGSIANPQSPLIPAAARSVRSNMALPSPMIWFFSSQKTVRVDGSSPKSEASTQPRKINFLLIRQCALGVALFSERHLLAMFHLLIGLVFDRCCSSAVVQILFFVVDLFSLKVFKILLI